jgi:hypothetical protein
VVARVIPAEVVTRLTRNNTILAGLTVLSLIVAIVAMKSAISDHRTVVSVDSRGVVTPIVPLDNPVLPDSRVIAFAEDCMRKAFSHDFLHYPTTVAQAQDCYTPSAGDAYVLGMDGFLQTIKAKQMVMDMTAVRPSRITRVYVKPTGYGAKTAAWDVVAKVDIYFEGKNDRIPPARYKIEMTVIRAPLEVTPKGIQIERFQVGPDGSN